MTLPSIMRWLSKPGDGAQAGAPTAPLFSDAHAGSPVLETAPAPDRTPDDTGVETILALPGIEPPPNAPAAPEPVAAEPVKTWLEHFNVANSLHQAGHLADAARAYRLCYEAGHPYPAEALSSSLLCRLKNGETLTPIQMAELQPFDPAYTAYISGAARLLIQHDPAGALEASGNAFESFHTGTEPDRFYLKAATEHFARAARPLASLKPYGDYGRTAVTCFPDSLIFYWDNNPPPEIIANFDYHRALGGFTVQVYNKQAAEAFLYDYYGRECRQQFTQLRHPAEEADYFRAHVMYAYGGCYLDADLRLRSTGSLAQVVASAGDAAVFLTAGVLVHNDLIVCTRQSRLMAECIRVITSNCANFPSLGIAMKTGPGAFTRAINRLYFRRIAFQEPDQGVLVLDQTAFERAVEEFPVSYKQDARNWQSV